MSAVQENAAPAVTNTPAPKAGGSNAAAKKTSNLGGAGVSPSPKKKPVTYTVTDTTATQGKRIHELFVNGAIRPFEFKDQYDEVPVPMAAALSLVSNPAFRVKDSNGNILKPRKRASSPELANALKINECIASYDELTHESLINRCANAGGSFSKSDSKDEMIAYLIARSEEEAADENLTPDKRANSEEGVVLEDDDQYA